MESSPTTQLIQLVPLMIMSIVYAVVVYIVARKRRVNPWGWTIGTLIPAIGLCVAAVFFLLTWLSMLDRLNALEQRAGTQGVDG